MHRVVIAVGLAVGLLLLMIWAVQAQEAPPAPLGQHCIDVGPLPLDDPAFCGCTWGEVLFRGAPAVGAVVTLTYGSGVYTGATGLANPNSPPYYSVTGHELGAVKGDVMTLTASYAGQTVSRSFRAWPGSDGEQRIVLALPEQGVWTPRASGGYTLALAATADTVWAGGPAGLLSLNLSSGISAVHALPWDDPTVRGLAVGNDGHIWAIGTTNFNAKTQRRKGSLCIPASSHLCVDLFGPENVAEYDGTTWHTHTPPFSDTLRALAVDAGTGAVWLGGGDTAGSVAIYTGTWAVAGNFAAPVTAVTVDGAGRAWVGTATAGVYRRGDDGGWTRYRYLEGLASDAVLSALSDDNAVWFGTAPHLSGKGPLGGISRYDLATGTWRTYTTAHGLPADVLFPAAPAPVYALALDPSGALWAGTVDGVYVLKERNRRFTQVDADETAEHLCASACIRGFRKLLTAPDRWWAYTSTHGLRSGPVRAVVAAGDTLVAATTAGLDRLAWNAVPGAPPDAQITSVVPLTVTAGTVFTLYGSGADSDEGGAAVVAWDWSSDRDGPLCTLPTCTLPGDMLSPGTHTLSLRVQDDEGVWSMPATRTLHMIGHQIYMALVAR